MEKFGIFPHSSLEKLDQCFPSWEEGLILSFYGKAAGKEILVKFFSIRKTIY